MVLVVKNPPANTGDIRDTGSTPGLGRCPEGSHGNPLQYSRLENSTDRGAWWATVCQVAKSWARLKRFSVHASIEITKKIMTNFITMYNPSGQIVIVQFRFPILGRNSLERGLLGLGQKMHRKNLEYLFESEIKA